MTRVGYSRVSTLDQSLDAQNDVLTAAGCERIFSDHGVSGKLAHRDQWDACMDYLREDDTLVVAKLDRMGRSLIDLVNIIATLGERKIKLVILDMGIDTSTAHGELVYHIMSALAQWERKMIVARTKAGLEAARARGRHGGRRPSLTPAQVKIAQQMYDATGPDGKPMHTVEDIAGVLKVSRPTIYRVLERKRDAPAKAS